MGEMGGMVGGFGFEKKIVGEGGWGKERERKEKVWLGERKK